MDEVPLDKHLLEDARRDGPLEKDLEEDKAGISTNASSRSQNARSSKTNFIIALLFTLNVITLLLLLLSETRRTQPPSLTDSSIFPKRTVPRTHASIPH